MHVTARQAFFVEITHPHTLSLSLSVSPPLLCVRGGGFEPKTHVTVSIASNPPGSKTTHH